MSIEVKVTDVQILDGKYLVLKRDPLDAHQAFVTPNVGTYTKVADYLLGCAFPKLESRELYSTESLAGVTAKLLTDPNKSVYRFSKNSPVTEYKYRKKVKKAYTWVQGNIRFGPDIEHGFPGPETISVDGDWLPVAPGVKVHGASPAFYIFNGKACIITKEGQDNGINSYVATFGYGDDDELFKDYIKNHVTAQQLVYIYNSRTRAEFTTQISRSATSVPDLNIEHEIEYIVSVYNSILMDADIAPTSDLLHGTTCVNSELLKSGLAYPSYNYNDAFISAQTTKELLDEYTTYLATEIPSLNRVPESSNGLWTKPYWRQKIGAISSILPGVLSASSLMTFMRCPYQYFATYYQAPSSERNDEDTPANDQKYAIVGTIMHANMERVAEKIVNEGVDQKIAAQTYKDLAVSNILGRQLQSYNYDFNESTVNALDRGFVADTIKKAFTDMFANVATRGYFAEMTKAISEFSLANTYVTLTDGTKVPFTGFIDTMILKKTGSTVDKFIILDWKSSSLPETEGSKFYITRSGGTITNVTPDIIQVVLYLYLIQQMGTIVIDGEPIDMPQGLSNDKAEIFYDLLKYTIAKGGKKDILPADRQTIFDKFIRPEIKRLVDSVRAYEADRNQDPGSIFSAKKDLHCKYCPVASICPVHAVSTAEAGRSKLLYDNRLRPLVSTTPTSIVSDDAKVAKEAMIDLLKMIKSGTIDVTNIREDARKAYDKRARELANIDGTYKIQIGATYLSSSVTSIQMIDRKRHISYNTLRSPSATVLRVEGTEKGAVVTIRFDSADTINTEMRHLLAQYTAFPYFSIRCADITRTFLPFEIYSDVYLKMGGHVENLVRRYFNLKENDARDSITTLLNAQSPALTKQEIYEEARLFYAVKSCRLSSVPNLVNCIDMIMEIRLHDVFTTTTAGTVNYLIDTPSVLAQLTWLYSSSTPTIPNQVGDTVIGNYYAGGAWGDVNNIALAQRITISTLTRKSGDVIEIMEPAIYTGTVKDQTSNMEINAWWIGLGKKDQGATGIDMSIFARMNKISVGDLLMFDQYAINDNELSKLKDLLLSHIGDPLGRWFNTWAKKTNWFEQVSEVAATAGAISTGVVATAGTASIIEAGTSLFGPLGLAASAAVGSAVGTAVGTGVHNLISSVLPVPKVVLEALPYSAAHQDVWVEWIATYDPSVLKWLVMQRRRAGILDSTTPIDIVLLSITATYQGEDPMITFDVISNDRVGGGKDKELIADNLDISNPMISSQVCKLNIRPAVNAPAFLSPVALEIDLFPNTLKSFLDIEHNPKCLGFGMPVSRLRQTNPALVTGAPKDSDVNKAIDRAKKFDIQASITEDYNDEKQITVSTIRVDIKHDKAKSRERFEKKLTSGSAPNGDGKAISGKDKYFVLYLYPEVTNDGIKSVDVKSNKQ